MTPAQLATLKAAILADPNVAASLAAGDHGAIAAYYAGQGAGFYWRSAIPVTELNTGIVWSAYVLMSAASQNAYMAMTQSGTIDGSSANVRAGFSSIFSGATLTNLTAIAQKVPTRAEALFVTNNLCSAPGLVIAVVDVILALGS